MERLEKAFGAWIMKGSFLQEEDLKSKQELAGGESIVGHSGLRAA